MGSPLAKCLGVCLVLWVCLLGVKVRGDACDDEVSQVISSCQSYVMGMFPPSPPQVESPCCGLLRAPSCIPCLCSKSLPAWAVPVINKQAVKNVLLACGLSVPPSAQCAGMNLAELRG